MTSKRYYYMRLPDSFFSRAQVKLILSQKSGYRTLVIYLQLCLLSLSQEGLLYFGDQPHTIETLAVCTSVSNAIMTSAMRSLIELNLVEQLTNGMYHIVDMQLMIGKSSTDADRKRKEREGLQKQGLLAKVDKDKCPPILEIDLEPEEETEEKEGNSQLTWAHKGTNVPRKSSIPSYTCEEGESL